MISFGQIPGVTKASLGIGYQKALKLKVWGNLTKNAEVSGEIYLAVRCELSYSFGKGPGAWLIKCLFLLFAVTLLYVVLTSKCNLQTANRERKTKYLY